MGLTAANFRVRVQGHPATVLNISNNISPRRIVLLLDASGSMLDSESALWKPALNIAKTLAQRLPPQDSVAFIAFASQVERRVDFTSDPKPILQELDDLQPGAKVIPKNMRKAALWDSVLEALRLFGSPRVGDSIYVITDGFDTNSHSDGGEVEKALLAAGVRLFALGLAAPARVRREGEMLNKIQDGPFLPQIADATGGAFFRLFTLWINGDGVPLGQTELDAALDQLKGFTHLFYRLEIEVPQPIDKSHDLEFEVVDPAHKGKLPLIIRYPHKLAPCEAVPVG
jgi:hypothetical protein